MCLYVSANSTLTRARLVKYAFELCCFYQIILEREKNYEIVIKMAINSSALGLFFKL